MKPAGFFAIVGKVIGMSPSGKAPGSGPGIRGFESLHPSQVEKISPERAKLESLGSDNDFIAGVVF